jgi:hypothetical protein
MLAALRRELLTAQFPPSPLVTSTVEELLQVQVAEATTAA